MAMVAIAAVAVVGIYAATRTVNVPGQKLGDLAVQTAKEGEPIPIIWGLARPLGGNLIAVQEPPRIERRKQKSGGKGGGGGSSTTVEVPRRTYAVGVCEGPITGYRRIWRNNKLVYDARPGSSWGLFNNGTFLQRFGLYLGSWDQLPDPDLESVFGVGNVPAHRGIAYMVARDEDLQDTGGAVPQWIFEVERAEGFALTSKPYAVEHVEELAQSLDLVSIELKDVIERTTLDEQLAQSLDLVGVELRDVLVPYDYPEPLEMSLDIAAIELRDVVIPYEFEESLEQSLDISSIALLDNVIHYAFEDELEQSLDIVAISLVDV